MCEIEDGAWKLAVDLPVQLGGSGSAPPPGVFGRAALGSCLAVGYMLHAARLRVPIASLEVEVQADCDPRLHLGAANLPATELEVRYMVTIESPASESDVRRVIDEGDARNPFLRFFAQPRPCHRTLRVLRVDGA